jgi:hypothetical protein
MATAILEGASFFLTNDARFGENGVSKAVR